MRSGSTTSTNPRRSKPRPAPQHEPFRAFQPEEVAIVERVRQACAGRSVWLLEEELGVSRENLRRAMQGLSRPSARLLAAICERYEVRADWLLLGRGPMTAEAKGGARGR